jgi:hypothetical protein
MDKLKKIFKGSDSQSSAATPSLDGPLPQGVLLTTNLGDITIALFADKTPKVR